MSSAKSHHHVLPNLRFGFFSGLVLNRCGDSRHPGLVPGLGDGIPFSAFKEGVAALNQIRESLLYSWFAQAF